MAGRVTAGALAEQLAREGWADAAEREEIAAQFLAWAEHPDGWFNLLHGEILARA